jgi:hypothetical protein
MYDLRWDMVGRAPDIGAAVMDGFERGQKHRIHRRQQSALAGLQANPSDPNALSELMAVDPTLAVNYVRGQREQATFERGERFRNALADYQAVSQPASRATPPAQPVRDVLATPASVSPVTTADTQSAPPGTPAVDPREAAFARMMREDPEQAYKLQQAERAAEAAHLKSVQDRLGLIGNVIGTVRDAASYARAREYLHALGLEEDHLPEAFDPEAVAQFASMARTEQERVTSKLQAADDARQDRSLAETERHNRAGEAVDQGNLAIRRSTERRIASGGGADPSISLDGRRYVMRDGRWFEVPGN